MQINAESIVKDIARQIKAWENLDNSDFDLKQAKFTELLDSLYIKMKLLYNTAKEDKCFNQLDDLICKFIEENGLYIWNTRDSEGNNLSHICAECELGKACKTFSTHIGGSHILACHTKDERKTTPMHILAQNKNMESVLIDIVINSCDYQLLESIDANGDTPLHLAVQSELNDFLVAAHKNRPAYFKTENNKQESVYEMIKQQNVRLRKFLRRLNDEIADLQCNIYTNNTKEIKRKKQKLAEINAKLQQSNTLVTKIFYNHEIK